MTSHRQVAVQEAGQFKQFAQFIATGLSGLVIGLATMWLLIDRLGCSVRVATAVMLVITFVYNFVLNHKITFRGSQENGLMCLGKFIFSRAATSYLNWVGVVWLVSLRLNLTFGPLHLCRMHYVVANTLSVGAITIINFVVSKNWVFEPGFLPRGNRVNSRNGALHRTLGKARRSYSYGYRPRHHAVAIKPPLATMPAMHVSHEGKLLPRWPEAPRRRVWRLPPRSRRMLQGLLSLAAIGAFGWGMLQNASATMITTVSLYSLPMFVIQARTLRLTSHHWRNPWAADSGQDRLESYEEPYYTFDILVPASNEAGVLYRNLRRMMNLNYPREMYRVLVGIGDADHELPTIAEARRAEQEFPGRIEVVLVPVDDRQSKPLSMIHMLQERVDRDLSFWLDAESKAAEDIMLDFNTRAMRYPEVAIWQGGVQLMNIWAPHRVHPTPSGRKDPANQTGKRRARCERLAGQTYARWDPRGFRWGSAWRGINCTEYRVWFKSRMKYQAEKGFITLGGNTTLWWTHVLKKVSWVDVPTEDADQAVRACVLGLPIRTFYVPELVTQEETPTSLRAWRVQRRRWDVGFKDVRGRGEWRQIPSLRKRLLAYELLTITYWQALSGIMIPLSLATAILYKAPVAIVLWTFLPAALSVRYALVLRLAFLDFCQEFQLRVTRLYMIRFVLFIPIYNIALAVAAISAFKRYVLKQYDWGKTMHRGEHFGDVTDPEPAFAG